MTTPTINFLNPFREVTSSADHDERGLALRSSFIDKLQATFEIFAGNERFHGFGFRRRYDPLKTYPILEETDESHLGLLDFATLGIPWAIGALFSLVTTKLHIPLQKEIDALTSPNIFLPRNNADLLPLSGYRFLSILLSVISLPLFLLHLALELTRLAVASALTVAAFFPVLAIHGISQAIRAYKIHKIEALDVIEVDRDGKEERKPLSAWLQQHNVSAEEIISSSNVEKCPTYCGSKQPFSVSVHNDSGNKTMFKLPVVKANQINEQEGLEDLADLSKNFNKVFSKK